LSNGEPNALLNQKALATVLASRLWTDGNLYR